MTKNESSNSWLWFIVRRSVVYMLVGGMSGAVAGAILIGLAGALIGVVLDVAHSSPSREISVALVGAAIGLFYGLVSGGIIGLLSWAIVGIIAPASRTVHLPKKGVLSMISAMAIATMLAVACYFAWCICWGLYKNGFVEAVSDNLEYAIFGVPTLMGIGQIAGVCRMINQLRKSHASSVTPEL